MSDAVTRDEALAAALTDAELAVVVTEIGRRSTPLARAYLAQASWRLARSDDGLRTIIRGIRRVRGETDD